MNELIYWFFAWFILTEIIYIYIVKKELFSEGAWLYNKIVSVLISLMFLLSQLFVLTIGSTETEIMEMIKDLNYINLYYEALILSFLFIFFQFNKWIYDILKKEVKK